MATITNKPSWSESRVKTLRQCHRQYWFSYYGSWGGWDRKASLECRQTYILKKMTNVPMWTGSIVHDTIEWIVRELKAKGQEQAPSYDQAIEHATQLLRRGWLDSTQKRWESYPSKAINLSEHYHNVGVPDKKIQDIKDKVARCLKNFYGCTVFQAIRKLNPEDILESEEFQSFKLKTEEEVAVKLDLAYRKDGLVYLVDWKTGRAEQSVIDQLVSYAMYAMKMGWASRVEDIRIVPVYLDSKHDIVELTPTMDHVKRQASIIQREFPLLIAAHNQSGDKSNFSVTDDPRACKWCNFRTICEGANTTIAEGATPF